MTEQLAFEAGTDPNIADALRAAIHKISCGGIEERGAVYTRQEVVEFILDLIGYTSDKPLHCQSLLEPAFGNGEFLIAAVDRLLAAYRANSVDDSNAHILLAPCVRAVELHKETFLATKEKLLRLLEGKALPLPQCESLVNKWLVQGDFLLTRLPRNFNYVVGNPPYVRQELIPEPLLAEYRRRFRTIFDRADIYIPFIEKSLEHLNTNGELGFICANRWTKNRYGGPLRELVSNRYHLKFYVDMVDTPAFHSEVDAYPAITVISNSCPGVTRTASRPAIDSLALSALARALLDYGKKEGEDIREIENATSGADPWILDSIDEFALVRRLESEFPTLEMDGCKVRIGVATGADKIFIAPYRELDIEPDRKLPLVMTKDILTGRIQWRGKGVINPFGPDGKLIALNSYPKFADYLRRHREELGKRHISRKNRKNWYRTIDRIYPELVSAPKLLIPDIKGEPHIVYDRGKYYPHHNLYFITSGTWDLRALRAVLLSGIARLFVGAYSTKMRGDYLRFQAQYLRRIRVPAWAGIPKEIRRELILLGQSDAPGGCVDIISEIYGFSKAERQILAKNTAL